MIQNDVSIIQLSRSQALLHSINPKIAYCVWARNSGKSSAGIATRVLRLSEVLPGAQVILFSDTFERLQDVIIPAIFAFLQNTVGLVEGIDYVKYKRPPADWAKPIVPLDKFDKVISFRTGFCLCLASQKVSGSANGFSAYALIVDETKFIKEAKINTEVLPAVRGNIAGRKMFGHLPEYCSKWYFTDKFGEEISWVLKKKNLMNVKRVNAVLKIQEAIYLLSAQLDSVSSSATIDKYKDQIAVLEKAANKLRQKLVFFSDPPPYDNLMIAGEEYFKEQRRDLSDFEYNVAILNYNPDRVVNTFYSKYNKEVHNYKKCEDVDPLKPFLIALDYQWRITPMPVAQIGTLPGHQHETFNLVAGIHTLHPKGGIRETVFAFCDYFEHHINKEVQYYFDQTAVARRPDGKSFYETASEAFIERGWHVCEQYIGKASDHHDRYNNFQPHFENDGEFAIRFNETMCESLITSVSMAATKTVNKKTGKDKKREKNLNYPAEEQTDYSEALDMILWGFFEMKMYNCPNVYLGNEMYVGEN